jgi:mono/diheme cytochrome c family protein
MWNKGPVMAREMKRRIVQVPPLGANELAAIVGYLYSLDYFSGPGDARRGEEIVKAKGCLGCHSVRGVGGGSGPDFEKMKGLSQPANVVSAMWNHGVVMERKMRNEALSWPVLTGEEMSQVVGYLEGLARSR